MVQIVRVTKDDINDRIGKNLIVVLDLENT
jgi:hypothetical protein